MSAVKLKNKKAAEAKGNGNVNQLQEVNEMINLLSHQLKRGLATASTPFSLVIRAILAASLSHPQYQKTVI
jgi:hypothetical protein